VNIVVETEQEIVQEVLNVLAKNLPPSKIARLLSIWRVGRGDYTADRRKLFAGETVASLFVKARVHEKRSRKRVA
jgi:hypothetical protein